MKKIVFIISFAIILFYGCTTKKSSIPGIDYGIIQNPSAEITDGSVVKGWTLIQGQEMPSISMIMLLRRAQKVFLLMLTDLQSADGLQKFFLNHGRNTVLPAG